MKCHFQILDLTRPCLAMRKYSPDFTPALRLSAYTALLPRYCRLQCHDFRYMLYRIRPRRDDFCQYFADADCARAFSLLASLRYYIFADALADGKWLLRAYSPEGDARL